MPDYEITSPDGKKFVITAPEGASQDEVLAYAKRQFSGEKSKPLPGSAEYGTRPV